MTTEGDIYRENIRAEIVLLSTYLSGLQISPSESHPNHATWPLFADISSLLTIGNSRSREAQNVNAVMGNVTSTAVDLLVSTENCAQDPTLVKAEQETLSNEAAELATDEENDLLILRGRTLGHRDHLQDDSSRAGMNDGYAADVFGDCVSIEPDTVRGRALLDYWNPLKERGFVNLENDFEFDAHLQDLLDVISALDNNNIDDLFRFQLFIHHRAYRKLAWRVLEFSKHWGTVPFEILSKHLDDNLEPLSITFTYRDPGFHSTIQSYVAPEISDGDPRSYSVNAGNASHWLNALRVLWERLETCLLETQDWQGTVKKSVAFISPSPTTVDKIVVTMYFFEALFPVIKHLLSANGVSEAFRAAEASRHNRKTSGLADNVVKEALDNSESEELHAIALFNREDSVHSEPVRRVLQAFRTILAWQTSCRHIYKEAHLFQTSQGNFSRFEYYDWLNPCVLPLKTSISLIREWEGPSDTPIDVDQVVKVVNRSFEAKVHAESALMHWIATVKDPDCNQTWPIGSGKKCCQLCWNLHQIYNRERTPTSTFVVSGTHGIFYPWLPPPGLPVRILKDLLTTLRDDRKKVKAHSRHSSTSSATSEMDTPFGRFQDTLDDIQGPEAPMENELSLG